MNQAEFLKYLEDFFASNINIARSKNSDYANRDAFANFRQIESLTGGRVTAIDGILTRMSDKMQRISNLAGGKPAAVKSESIHDTLKDLANYCAILSAFIDNSNKEYSGTGQTHVCMDTLQSISSIKR